VGISSARHTSSMVAGVIALCWYLWSGTAAS
jgi:hypothetical protein